MTTGPTEEQCGTPEGGPGGMPLALRLSEGLGLPPPAVDWPQDLPLRDGGAVSAARYWTGAQMLAERERAHNAGFVEASRLHGAEIERLRAYANAAHWWAEAHDNELAEAGDTRFDARSRMLDAEAALLAAGHVFERAERSN